MNNKNNDRGVMRLLIVIAVTAVAVWLLWTPYRDAFDQVGQQLRSNRGGHSRPADDMPRGYPRKECTGSIWSDKLQCGPWRDAPAHEEGR
jgi:hypothetical protein